MALIRRSLLMVSIIATILAPTVLAQEDSVVSMRNDSLSARLINVDLRLVVQVLARYLDRPVLLGQVGEVRVTLETPRPIPRRQVPDLLRGILRPHGLVLTEEEALYTVGPPLPPAPVQAAGQSGPMQFFVLRLRHAGAVDVAATINTLFGRASALGEIGAPPPTLAEGLRENLMPPAESAGPKREQPLIQQAAELTGEVTIVPDLRTNSLLIRASRADFDLLRAAVEQLDVRPLQVLIEVVIAELRRDRSLSFGTGVLVPRQRLAGNTDISGSSTGLSVGDFVLEIMKLGTFDVTATLRSAASRGDVTILSRPVILAANNGLAEIMVGSQRPFVQVQRALPTDNGVRDQVVQFKDVGTKLSVRPTISDDGYVMLNVTQEVNAATAEIAFDAPVISTRTIQTQLLVKDGHTAVLGGLADKQEDFTRAGIPVLSGIPIVGGLFGRQVKRTTETELFVFLTPRVIRSDDELDSASDSVGTGTKELRRRSSLAPTAESRPAQPATEHHDNTWGSLWVK